MFAQPPRVRRLAAKLLLVWLFALATGIVNACVIAPGMHSMTSQGRTDEHAAVQPAAGEHAAGCPDGPDDDSAARSQGPCAKFCADESSGVPAAKQAFDPWPALGIAVVPTMALAVADAGPGPVDRLDGAPRRRASLPIPIAFLRLTL
ncbi:MAG: hypothetical protein JNL87_12405 [Burkholderiaceae bacterium]|nr:hypothetical protein [Burkholderiaceae bacterium]